MRCSNLLERTDSCRTKALARLILAQRIGSLMPYEVSGGAHACAFGADTGQVSSTMALQP